MQMKKKISKILQINNNKIKKKAWNNLNNKVNKIVIIIKIIVIKKMNSKMKIIRKKNKN